MFFKNTLMAIITFLHFFKQKPEVIKNKLAKYF